MSSDAGSHLLSAIETKEARIGVMGMGYVGLPLMELFGRCGFRVMGFDVDEGKVRMANEGSAYIDDVESSSFSSLVEERKIEATTDHTLLSNCDAIMICVPTPFTKAKDPDISYVETAARDLASVLRSGQLVMLRSTTFPETTEKIVLPLLQKSGLKVGRDFFLSFSPERIDPGNRKYTVHNTPAVVGGVTETCTRLSMALYGGCGVRAVPVSSPRVAEMSKLLENIYRSVNIALVNELAMLCDRMGGIDIWEVINAASTKPFGFMPFYPGPGIGGHCILVDPYYLSWKAREYDFHTNFIQLAAETNEGMPYYVVEKVFEALRLVNVNPSSAKVLVLGVTFKKNVADTRNSPAIKVISLLHGTVERISYTDPYIESVRIGEDLYPSVPLTEETLRGCDCVLITADHDVYDFQWIADNSKIVVDTRNATKSVRGGRLLKLGAGRSA